MRKSIILTIVSLLSFGIILVFEMLDLPAGSSIAGVILGFALPAVCKSLNQQIKLYKAQREINNHRVESIIITGIGVPYYDLSRDIRITDSHKSIYLSPPAKHKGNPEYAEYNLKAEDTSFMKLSLPDIPQDIFDETLEAVREEVFDNMISRDDGFHFNGSKYGIASFNSLERTSDSSERPQIIYQLFKTDYFTHTVLEKVMYRFRDKLPDINPQLLSRRDFPLFRTSIGISLIVVLKSTNEIILTKRSKNSSYSESKEWYYVSVTEALSDTDFDEYLQAPSIVNCVKRGLIEELNIKPSMYDENTIKLYDTFYESYFLQDGLVISVELNDDVIFSDIASQLAKDHIMEVGDVLLINNTSRSIDKFICENKEQMRPQTVFALKSYMARI